LQIVRIGVISGQLECSGWALCTCPRLLEGFKTEFD
jgi:hypothetical protein